MSTNTILNNINIVLVKPRFPENIGATARAMLNMGITNLSIVQPERFELDKVLKMATHVAADIVHNANIFPTLGDALKDINYVAGTSARKGKQRSEFLSPSELAQALHPICESNKTAILFGPEDRGLTNEELLYCNLLVQIPTSGFSSLNLSQAVMVICYEIFNNCTGKIEKHMPRLASVHELEGLYDQMQNVLEEVEFHNPQNPDYWTNRFRDLLQRFPIRAKEVKLIHGLLKNVLRYGENQFSKGFNSNK